MYRTLVGFVVVGICVFSWGCGMVQGLNQMIPEPKTVREKKEEKEANLSSIVRQVPSTKSEGLGVSREYIQSLFTGLGAIRNFYFEVSTPVDGRERILGTAKDRLAYMELIGPPENVYKATVMVIVPEDHIHMLNTNHTTLAEFLRRAVPSYKYTTSWVTESFAKLYSKDTVEYSHKHLRIVFTLHKSIGMLTLSISPK